MVLGNFILLMTSEAEVQVLTLPYVENDCAMSVIIPKWAQRELWHSVRLRSLCFVYICLLGNSPIQGKKACETLLYGGNVSLHSGLQGGDQEIPDVPVSGIPVLRG